MIWSPVPGCNCRFDAGTYIYTSDTAIPVASAKGLDLIAWQAIIQ